MRHPLHWKLGNGWGCYPSRKVRPVNTTVGRIVVRCYPVGRRASEISRKRSPGVPFEQRLLTWAAVSLSSRGLTSL
jgi:hypothetical protein